MRYKYGGFTFDIGECALEGVSVQSIYTPQGERYLIAETHTCSGEIIPPTTLTSDKARQSWILDRIRRIKNALAFEGRDAGLLNDDGTRSANYLLASDSVSGIRMTKPLSFGRRDQADGVSGRTFSFSLTKSTHHLINKKHC